MDDLLDLISALGEFGNFIFSWRLYLPIISGGVIGFLLYLNLSPPLGLSLSIGSGFAGLLSGLCWHFSHAKNA